MESIFAGTRLRLLAWEAEYGPELPLDAPAAAEDDVDLAVEQPADAWRPVVPLPSARPRRTVFVDGVRRIDVRLVGSRAGRSFHGLFGSYAVGTSRLEPGSARLDAHVVARRVVLGSGEALERPVTLAPGLAFEPISTPEEEPDAPLRALQSDMRRAEEELARAATRAGDALVVVDGPLSFEGTPGEGVVGYVKRIHDLYLPSDRRPFLAALPAGARTPLFALTHSRRFSRYAWFVRLAPPRVGDADLVGLARLECVASIGVDAARALADAIAALLPQVAPSRGRDPRSPQNLLPISAIETSLRRWLGDPRVVRSQVERAIVRDAMHAEKP
jgi:hypothetical protein